MAVITSATTGNFSDTATWVGGVVPTSVDDAVAATGTVVTIDTNVTVLSFQQAGTGKFVLGGGRTVTGNVIANAGTFTSGGTVEVTAGVGTTATINGNVTGVSSTANNIVGIVVTGVGTLVLNGSVTGPPGNNISSATGSAAIYTNVTCAMTVNGNLTGGLGEFRRGIHIGTSSNAAITIFGNVSCGLAREAHAIFMNGLATTATITGDVTAGVSNSPFAIWMVGGSNVVTVTGNVFGSTGASAAGIYSSGGSNIITVTGNVVAGSGTNSSGVHTLGASTAVTVTGNISALNISNGILAEGASSTVTAIGSVVAVSTLSHGIRCNATANGVIFQGNLTDSLQGATAIYSRLLRVTATNTGTTTYTNTVGYPNGTPVTRVSPNLVTGMPAATNVRNATVYGFNNELTGTMKIPPAGSVALGVQVDNTTGTAALDVGSVIAVIGAQIAAASSDPVGI